MATSYTLTSSLYPNGTTVSVYAPTDRHDGAAPSGSSVASAVVSGGAVTFAGLPNTGGLFAAYAFVSGEHRYQYFYDQPSAVPAGTVVGVPRVINVKDAPYNGVPSTTTGGTTDQGANIAAAIAACSALGGGDVFLDDGYWGHTQTLVIPDNVRLTGVAVNSGPTSNVALLGTRLVAMAGFPIMSPQVTLGQRLPATVGTTGLVFGAKLANLMLDGNFLAWFGAYTNKAQEHCAINEVSTQRHPFIGIWAATPNGAPGANQTNNFGMSDVKVALGYASGLTYAYTSLTFVGSAPTVGASSTNPYDSLSNITRPVTTPGESSGVVTVSSTAGLPAQGVFIAAPVTADNPPVVVCYTSIVDGTRLGGCLTDANPSSGTPTPLTALDTAKNVDFNGAGIYIQNVGAFRGINGYTLDMGVSGAAAVGMRLDQCNGVFTRGHAESVKYGILLNAAGRCNGVVIQGLMTGDNTLTDLVRISANFSGNSQHGISFSGIANRVNGAVNTINDLLNGKVVKDGYVGLYVIGDSTYGALSGRPILSAASSILSKFTKGLFLPTKAGAFADSDFNETAAAGLIGVNTSTGLLEWRGSSAWASLGGYAPLASPVFTGSPTAPTPSSADNTTKVATTAMVQAAIAGVTGGGGSAYYPWAMNNLLGWAWDPINNNTGAGGILTGGVLALTKVAVTPLATLTNILAYVTTAGATLTSGQCLAAVFDSAGNLLGTSADQSATWNSTGLKTMALTAQSAGSLTLAAGVSWVYVALLSNGTTQPTFAIAPGATTGALVNAGLTSGNGYRGGTILTGQTSMPTSITPSGVSSIGTVRWSGVN